jgi:hypothetical protein
MAKVTYRVKNWSEYNHALCRRGDVTLWIDEETIMAWYASPTETQKHGAQFVYGDAAILCALTLRAIYHLPLRQTRGFLQGLLSLMGLDLRVPCYSTLSRRAKGLEIELPSSSAPTHIVIDSTGLKIYGEGEWKVRLHGVGKRRTWRKLHLAVNPKNHEITSASLTTNDIHDSQVFPDILDENDPIEVVYADGAYDASSCYRRIAEIGAQAVIPPRRGAKIEQHGNSSNPPLPRDRNIRGVRTLGRKGWKVQSCYHTRSLAEIAMYRIKQIFGGNLRSRSFDQQATEAFVRSRAMNLMSMLGMPASGAITT